MKNELGESDCPKDIGSVEQANQTLRDGNSEFYALVRSLNVLIDKLEQSMIGPDGPESDAEEEKPVKESYGILDRLGDYASCREKFNTAMSRLAKLTDY